MYHEGVGLLVGAERLKGKGIAQRGCEEEVCEKDCRGRELKNNQCRAIVPIGKPPTSTTKYYSGQRYITLERKE